MILAKDIMLDEIIVIYDDMRIRQVARLMLRDRVSGFPVVSRDMGIVGIITITDLFRIITNACAEKPDKEFHKRIAHCRDMAVADVMSRQVIAIRPETTLDEIIDIVQPQHVHTFPVVDGKKLVGIIGRHDILNAIFSYDD